MMQYFVAINNEQSTDKINQGKGHEHHVYTSIKLTFLGEGCSKIVGGF